MRRVICSALVALALAVPMFAELSAEYENWAEGPVMWLLTDEERAEWKAVSTDAEAQKFIDLFWARRDPTPSTPRNEFREVFQARVKVADEQFDEPRTPGSLSPRGRVFLLLGSPHRTSLSLEAAAAGASDTQASREIWHYEREAKPPFAEGPDFDIEFIDKWGRGRFELSMTGRRPPLKLLNEAIDYYLVQPELSEVPRFDATTGATESTATVGVAEVEVEEVSTEFENQYLKAVYDEFKREAIAEEDDLHVTYGEYITPSGRYYVPVQLYIPGTAGLDTSGELTFFGVVEKEDGEIVAVYEEPVTLLASNADAYYDKSLMLQPGDYVGTFGLARDNEPIAIAKTELDLEGLTETDPSVSALILSNNIFPLTEAQKMTDPYAFGGLKVVPKGDATFASQDELWYFFELRNPGLSDEGTPKIRVKLDVEGEKADGTPVKMGAPMMEVNAEPVKDTPGHYMVGSSFPAGAFPPGNYTLKARIFDSVSKQTWNLEKNYTIVD